MVGASAASAAAPRPAVAAREASVSQTRSFAAEVRLEVSDDLKGWADFGDFRKPENIRAFAIAAAAQAAGKKVYMTWTDLNRGEYQGGGKFENVKLALRPFES